MAVRKKTKLASSTRPIPMSLPFLEDQRLFGSPADIEAVAGQRLVLD